MIEIAVPKHEDILRIEQFLKNHSFNHLNIDSYISNCMVAYDKEKIIGATGFIQNDPFVLITFIVVDQQRRRDYIGEGLMKALLNLAYGRGIQKAIVNQEGDFFQKLGFSKSSPIDFKDYFDVFIDDLNPENPILEVSLKDYFKKACKSCSK